MAAPRTSRAVSSFICQSCLRRNPTQPQKRFLASTPSLRADSATPPTSGTSSQTSPSSQQGGALGGLANTIKSQPNPARSKPVGFRNSFLDDLDKKGDPGSLQSGKGLDDGVTLGPHRLHVFATKHNTHLTLVQAARPASETTGTASATKGGTANANKMVDVLLTMSSGNLGFRKAGRNSFDAAYQLTGYFFTQMRERGMLRDIQQIEIVLRGYGAGREAVQKVVLGPEGRAIRQKVSAVRDSTRLKHGGPRGKKPRRLG